jgi:hypothetical protein
MAVDVVDAVKFLASFVAAAIMRTSLLVDGD